MALTAGKKAIFSLAALAIVVVAAILYKTQLSKPSAALQPLVIGMSPSFAKTLQVAADEAKQQGLDVKLVEFSDWNTPNITLNHGDIDANFFQHQPFLDNTLRETGFKLKAFATGVASHVGLYSKIENKQKA